MKKSMFENMRDDSNSQDVNPVTTGFVVGVAVASAVIGICSFGMRKYNERVDRKNWELLQRIKEERK